MLHSPTIYSLYLDIGEMKLAVENKASQEINNMPLAEVVLQYGL